MTFVAEVWLEHPFGRGATMYRAQAQTRHRAMLKAKIAALKLDRALPYSYATTDWQGRPCRLPYEFGILYGARPLAPSEEQDGITPICTTEMPGTSGFTGEHASRHPLLAAYAESKAVRALDSRPGIAA